jgi:ubiquitin carboxyl-terminal hydrolase L3
MATNGDDRGDSGPNWIPLESNPEVLSGFAHALGVPDAWCFTDVWSPEPDLLALVPTPCLAIVFLFPLTDRIVAAENARVASAAPRDEHHATEGEGPYFCRQTIGNACGTIALIHAVLNNQSRIELRPASFFSVFLEKTASLAPDERAAALHEEPKLNDAHREFAAQGQTAAPDPADDVNLHFVAFVQHRGILYELDGRKPSPIQHGPSGPDSFLLDACSVVKSLMASDPSELRYTILALTPAQSS